MDIHLADSLKIHAVYQPDEERRASLFSVLLVAVLALCAPVSIYALAVIYFGDAVPRIDAGFHTNNLTGIAVAASSMSLLAGAAFLLNRARKLPAPRLAASLFIIAITAFIVLSDSPAQVIAGRTSFMLLLPVFLASVLVFPAASVTVAILEMLALVILAPGNAAISNFSLVMIYFFALLAWASAHSGESAIAAALRESTKNKTILESAADGLVVFDLNGEVVQLNAAAHRLLNEMAPPELLRAVNQTESQNDVWKIEGEGRTLAITKARMLENGRAVGTVLGIRDFTREVMIERMKDAILGVVSHELRTPAAAIKGYVDVLKTEGVSGDQAREAVEIISRNVQRLLFLINDLLDRASIQAGKLKIINGRFSVAALVDRVKEVVEDQLEDKEGTVELSFDVDGALPATLLGDINRLLQIMVNLIGNGIKFTDKGTVNVRMFAPDQNHWEIEVRDTGMGIPEGVMEFIFEPLRRAPDYSTRTHPGAGLGLSIIKELVTMMGGSIEVESQVGKGSIFRVRLPIIEEQ
jgi:signal transduction histidine kinase